MEINDSQVSSYLSSILSDFSQTTLPFSYDKSRLDWLYRDGLAREIVNKYPENAYNAGVDITSDDRQNYLDLVRNLQIYEKFRDASIAARLYGIAVILIGANDGQLLVEPLAVNTTTEIEWLRIYNISEQTILNNRDTIYLLGEEVHKSRLLFFYGSRSFQNTVELNYQYDSVLASCGEVLVLYRSLSRFINALIKKGNQFTLGTEGLSSMLQQDLIRGTTTNREAIQARANALELGRNLLSTLVYDKSNESVENVSLSLNGIQEACDQLRIQLELSLDYPTGIIFDRQISNMGSGQQAQLIQRMEWARALSNWIDNNWTRNLEYLIGILQQVYNLRDFQINVPLSMTYSALELVEINKGWSEILNSIQNYYPMTGDELKEFIENNFVDMFVPERENPRETVEESEISDEESIGSFLTRISNITQVDVDETCERIGNFSREE